jgi:hypothetical protein
VIDSIRPHEPTGRHPVIAALAIFAFLPLLLLGLLTLRHARSVELRPLAEDEIPGEPARKVRRAAHRDLAFAVAGLAIALILTAGRV